MKRLKILVFEYISGGGLAGQALPPSLAAEGGMMLQALIGDLKSLPDIQLSVPLDARCAKPALLQDSEITVVDSGQDIMAMLPALLAEADLFWPIAPESGGILRRLAEMAIACNTETLLSDPATLALCADKWATYKELTKHRLPAVETRLLGDSAEGWIGDLVVKIADGVGCQDSFVVNADHLPAAIAGLRESGRYIIQPYKTGQAASLSCLFKRGQGWLLCCNQQQIVLGRGRFSLQGCLVNVDNPKRKFYQHLVAAIAEAMPGLWGYVGIDVIETAEVGPLVLEINPRLTTSYVGIRQATGINVAEQTLRLLEAEPELRQVVNRVMPVAIP